MSFGAPLGLIGLAAIPVLVALYFLRRRQPPRVVSALFLWRSPDERAEAGPRLQRFSREASLALEVAAALAATAFLADLRCGSAAIERHTVLVLDGSLSMSARTASGRSVADAALEVARRIAREDGGRVTVIESGLRPKLLAGPGADASALASIRFMPRGPSHDLSPALGFARELAGPRVRVRLVTDRPLGAAPDGVEVFAVGEPLDNVAIVGAVRRDSHDKTAVSIRLAQFGAREAEVALELRAPDGRVVHREPVRLKPGEERGVRVELSATGELTASVGDDALAEDGRALLLPNPPRPLKAAVAIGESIARDSIQRLLAADGAASVAEPADLTFDAPDRPTAPWHVRVGIAGEAHTYVGPFFPDRAYPLLDGVPLEGVLWTAGPSTPGRPLLTAGRTVLVSEEPGPVLHLNVDLARSNLQRTAAWPILLENLLTMRRDALTGFARRHAALGEEMSVTLAPGARWTLAGPDGEQPLRGAGAVPLAPFSAPGRYRLLRDGKLADEVAVNAVDPSESDLRDRGSGHQRSPAPIGRVAASDDGRRTWPLLALAALLAADWLVTAGRLPRFGRKPEGRAA